MPQVRNSKGETPSQFITHLTHKLRIATNYVSEDSNANHRYQIALEVLILREILDEGWRLVPVSETN